MRTPDVIIVPIRSKQTPQMGLVAYDDVIQTLAADAPDEALTVGILPRAVGRNLDLFHPQVLDPLLACGPIGRVAVFHKPPAKPED